MRGRNWLSIALLLVVLVIPQLARAQISTGVDIGFTLGTGTTGDVRLIGDAFPNAFVTILKDNAVIDTSTANSSSVFDRTITGLTPGIVTFSLFAQDSDGHKTVTISFSVSVISNSTVTVSGLLLSPILIVPDSIKRPEKLNESGLAKQNSTVTTFTHSDPIVKQGATNTNGQWAIIISDVLHLGSHSVTALVQDSGGGQSQLTSAKDFIVKLSADLNIDDFVNLTDFSILMFNYGTSNPPNLAADINDNGPVDLVDFSIMMFYWTR